jgi:CDP-glucose 4,6-dehydratase
MLADAIKSQNGPVLITGHTGFKGTWLSLLLNRLNVENYGFALEAEAGSLYSRLGGRDILPGTIGDIRDLTALSEVFRRTQPTVVIHMAAQPLVLKSYESPLETFEINVIGTANVLKTAFDTPSVKVVLVITTDKVYRNDDSGRRFKEEDPLAGKDPYSASKVGAEAVCAAWQQLSKISGGPKVIIARAGNVIGGGDFAENRIIPDIVRGVIADKPITIRNPLSSRPWQHVLDPLAGYLLYIDGVLKGDINFAAVNFGPQEASLQVKEILEISRELLGVTVRIEIKEEEVQRESKVLELNADLANQSLMWVPKWSQTDAIRDTFSWWRSVLNDPKKAFSSCAQDIDSLLATFLK